MKKIELTDPTQQTDSEETEVTMGDWLRIYIGERGNLEIMVQNTSGTRTELSFDEDGDLTSMVRDL